MAYTIVQTTPDGLLANIEACVKVAGFMSSIFDAGLDMLRYLMRDTTAGIPANFQLVDAETALQNEFPDIIALAGALLSEPIVLSAAVVPSTRYPLYIGTMDVADAIPMGFVSLLRVHLIKMLTKLPMRTAYTLVAGVVTPSAAAAYPAVTDGVAADYDFTGILNANVTQAAVEATLASVKSELAKMVGIVNLVRTTLNNRLVASVAEMEAIAASLICNGRLNAIRDTLVTTTLKASLYPSSYDA